MTEGKTYQVCSRSVLDSTIPGIQFDKNGVSNYCLIYDALVKDYPRGEKGKEEWSSFVEKMKRMGKNQKYDCLIGVSGGTDSSYLLHLAREYGLRPLAVNLDNGWNSETSVRNIKKITRQLNIDLETYVINYEEIKDIIRSYMKASLPWIDVPTDIAIESSLYKIANREGVKYILTGNDFRSEGKQPTEWTYSDGKQLKYLQKKFGKQKLKTFPNLTLSNLIYYGFVSGIKLLRPFYYLEYNKQEAQELLKKKYEWEYYGGHHHENLFTKFAIAYWLPNKFGIDKRKITLSAQVLSGVITRDVALNELANPPYDPELMERDKEYVLKKLDFTDEEFQKIWNAPNKSFLDYPSYYPLIVATIKTVKPLFKYILPFKPMIFTELEIREKKA